MNYQDSSGKAQKEKTVWEGIAVSLTPALCCWAGLAQRQGALLSGLTIVVGA